MSDAKVRGLRTLIIGDLHYSSKNLKDHAKLAAAIHAGIDAYAKQQTLAEDEIPLDLIVCLGDELEHHNPPADVRGACVQFLRSLAARTRNMIVLVGNHTRRNNQVSVGPDHTLAEISAGGRITVVEDPVAIEIDGIRFGALPYIDPPAFDEILRKYLPELSDGGSKLSFVLGHQELRSSIVRKGHESECLARWGEGWPPLISGHLHQRHIVGAALYVGTPMQHSLSETTDKYVYFGILGRPATDTTAWTHIPSTAPFPFGPKAYVSSAGILDEYVPPGIPRRYEHSVKVQDLPAVLTEVLRGDDYWRIRVGYVDQTEFITSPAYAQLAAHPHVRLTTEQIQVARPQQSVSVEKDGQRKSFYERLCTAAPSPLVRELLEHVAGKIA